MLKISIQLSVIIAILVSSSNAHASKSKGLCLVALKQMKPTPAKVMKNQHTLDFVDGGLRISTTGASLSDRYVTSPIVLTASGELRGLLNLKEDQGSSDSHLLLAKGEKVLFAGSLTTSGDNAQISFIHYGSKHYSMRPYHVKQLIDVLGGIEALRDKQNEYPSVALHFERQDSIPMLDAKEFYEHCLFEDDTEWMIRLRFFAKTNTFTSSDLSPIDSTMRSIRALLIDSQSTLTKYATQNKIKTTDVLQQFVDAIEALPAKDNVHHFPNDYEEVKYWLDTISNSLEYPEFKGKNIVQEFFKLIYERLPHLEEK